MAVNENDRVSTRRLKQFYDKLKLELASMFKDAKPNYNLMNENKQLGQGYGWNYKGQQFFTYNIGTSARINTDMLIQGFNSIGAFPNSFVYNTLNSVKGYYGSANYNRKHELILSSLTGSLIVVPKEITAELINDEWIDPNYEFPFDWLNGTFDSDLIALVSPVITFEGHTYQTRLRSVNNKDAQSSQVDQYIYEVKIDGGEWTERYMQNDCFAWSFGLQHPLVNIGERFVGDNSVDGTKLVNKAVTLQKVADEVYQKTIHKFAVNRASWKMVDGVATEIYPNVIWKTYYSRYSSNSYYYFHGTFVEGSYDSLCTTTYGGVNSNNGQLVNVNNTLMYLYPDDNVIQLRNNALINSGSIKWRASNSDSTIYKSRFYCTLLVHNSSGWHTFIGRIIVETDQTYINIEPLDSTFFTAFANPDDTLIIQSFYQPDFYL